MLPVITLGPVELSSYALMLALGGCVGFWLTVREIERDGLEPWPLLGLAALTFTAGVAGARALSLALHWPRYARQPWWSLVAVWDRGGLAFYGGLLLAGVVGLLFARLARLPVRETADRLVLAWIPFLVCIRIGCFLNGCCYGKPTTSVLGLVAGGPPNAVNFGIPSHPTQLYDAAALFGIFVLLRWMRGRPHPAGMLALVFLGLHSVVRFGLEPLRGDPRGIFPGPLTLNQWIAAAVLGTSLAAAPLLYSGVGLLRPRRRSRSASTAARPSGSE